jgi:hypothetical protein
LIFLFSERGRDRDRTDDLYRVKVARVVYRNDSSQFALHHPGGFLLAFGAYCSQFVPNLFERQTTRNAAGIARDKMPTRYE